MDQHRRPPQNQSFQGSAKDSRQILALALTCGLLSLSACSHKKTSARDGWAGTGNPQLAKDLDLSSPLGAKLTSVGENESPRLSPTGNEFLFLSSHRPTHPQPQVYVYDLGELSEKRVTYQDGQCDSPLFVNEAGDIVYASTTDEIKERPALLLKDHSSETPSELYFSDISGSRIRRLTRHPGYDGDPVMKPNSHSLYFSQEQDGAKRILQLNLSSAKDALVLAKKGVSIENFSPSPSGKNWLWLETNLTDHQTRVWLAEKSLARAQEISLPEGDYRDFSWIDDSHLILSARLEKKKYSELMTYEINQKCLRPLLADQSNLTQPQVLPQQRSLIFVSDAGGARQIYYRSVPANETTACLNPPTAPTVSTTTTSTTVTSTTSTSTVTSSTTTTTVTSTTTTAPKPAAPVTTTSTSTTIVSTATIAPPTTAPPTPTTTKKN
jgi:Tol biopolymer transport system component